MFVYSCDWGYEGAYCQSVTMVPPELPLLVSLVTLLPVAAIMVGVVASVLIYRRLKTRQNLLNSRKHGDNVRAKYACCMLFGVPLFCLLYCQQWRRQCYPS